MGRLYRCITIAVCISIYTLNYTLYSTEVLLWSLQWHGDRVQPMYQDDTICTVSLCQVLCVGCYITHTLHRCDAMPCVVCITTVGMVCTTMRHYVHIVTNLLMLYRVRYRAFNSGYQDGSRGLYASNVITLLATVAELYIVSNRATLPIMLQSCLRVPALCVFYVGYGLMCQRVTLHNHMPYHMPYIPGVLPDMPAQSISIGLILPIPKCFLISTGLPLSYFVSETTLSLNRHVYIGVKGLEKNGFP